MRITPTLQTRTVAQREKVRPQHVPATQKPANHAATEAHTAGPLTRLRPHKAPGATLPILPMGLCTNFRPHKIQVCPYWCHHSQITELLRELKSQPSATLLNKYHVAYTIAHGDIFRVWFFTCDIQNTEG